MIVLLTLSFGAMTSQSCFWSMTDHLFEVTVEMNFRPDLEENWDSQSRSLLLSVKALVCQQKAKDIKGTM